MKKEKKKVLELKSPKTGKKEKVRKKLKKTKDKKSLLEVFIDLIS